MLAKALTVQGKAKPQALSARNEAIMLTDAAIKKALKTGRNATLTDGTGRGSGRLALQVRAMPKRTLAEWYAVQWLAGKRRSVKLGSYPSMSLGEARTKFQEHSEAIEDRKDIRYARKASGTVAELVEGYTAWLKANNRPSAHKIQYALKYIKPIEHLQANQVAPSDIVEILKPIHARGAPSMADHVRSYISSAFGWGIRSENDYRLDTPKRFLIKSNPVLSIPSGEKRRGERWLTKEELRQVWAYLSNPTRNPTNFQTVDSNLDCIKVILLTGQRVQEIAGIREEMVVGDCLELPTTKNGLAHVVPLPKRAREIIAAQKPRDGCVPCVPQRRSGWPWHAAGDHAQVLRTLRHGLVLESGSEAHMEDLGRCCGAIERDQR